MFYLPPAHVLFFSRNKPPNQPPRKKTNQYSKQGLRKPAPEAFAAVCEHLGVPPSSCVFVDDRAVNVDAAAAFGMRALRFEGCADALERGLRERGLEF